MLLEFADIHRVILPPTIFDLICFLGDLIACLNDTNQCVNKEDESHQCVGGRGCRIDMRNIKINGEAADQI